MSKVDRISYIDEALYNGMESPIANDINYKLVDRKAKDFSFSPLKKEDDDKKS
jgi:hypothetical protein